MEKLTIGKGNSQLSQQLIFWCSDENIIASVTQPPIIMALAFRAFQNSKSEKIVNSLVHQIDKNNQMNCLTCLFRH